MMPKFRFLMAVLLCCFSSAFAQELPQFDFTKPETQSQAAREWTAAHDISKIEGTGEGMVISIGGNDPIVSARRAIILKMFRYGSQCA